VFAVVFVMAAVVLLQLRPKVQAQPGSALSQA
jgi:hypothetical protein